MEVKHPDKAEYRFFKHNGVWRYKRRNDVTGKEIGTFALEGILGVVGGPLVIVVRGYPNGLFLRLEVKNGFLASASIIESLDTPMAEGYELDQFCVDSIHQ